MLVLTSQTTQEILFAKVRKKSLKLEKREDESHYVFCLCYIKELLYNIIFHIFLILLSEVM